MITFKVDQSEIGRMKQLLDSWGKGGQLEFAVARALTRTAASVQAETRAQMPGRFTIRRPWVIQQIKMKPARKGRLVAEVYASEAADFLGLQETGGTKDPRGRYVAIPTSMVRRTKRDMIRKSDRPRNLGDRAEIVEYNGNKFLALKRPRKGANGQRLRFLYLLEPRANIDERLGLRRDGERVVRAMFGPHLRQSIIAAVQTARR